MGANVSTNISKLEKELKNSLSATCEATNDIVQIFKGNELEFNDVDCGNITIGNKARATSKCDMDVSASVLSKYASMLTEEQKAGLGLNISTSIDENKTTIKNELEAKCGASNKIEQTLTDNKLTINRGQCDRLQFFNEADATSTCVMKIVGDVTDEIKKETTKKQSGFDPTMIFGIIAGVVLFLIIGLVIFLLFSGGGGNSGAPAGAPAGAPMPTTPRFQMPTQFRQMPSQFRQMATQFRPPGGVPR